MTGRRAAYTAGYSTVAMFSLVLVYALGIRPVLHTWGATPAEARQPMAGDDLVRRPFMNATRAITIAAPPERVWPWLLQIGSGRAGWYSYDGIDNGGVPSSETVIPALQHLAVGDQIPMVPGKPIGPWVREIDEGRGMLWWDRAGGFTWSWQLLPTAAGTRLVTRVRATFPWRQPWYGIVADAGDVVMTWKMLRGIKTRAEHLAASPPPASDDPYNRTWPCPPSRSTGPR